MVAERSPEKHRDTRRLLSHGFGAKALKDQEDVLHQHCDLFISQLRKHSAESSDGLDMKEVSGCGLSEPLSQTRHPNDMSKALTTQTVVQYAEFRYNRRTGIRRDVWSRGIRCVNDNKQLYSRSSRANDPSLTRTFLSF